MKLINPFKKQQKQNSFIEVKYSKLDHIGKVKRYEIPDKNEIDNLLSEMNNKITELTNKLNNIPESFFERIKNGNLNSCYTSIKEIQLNARDIQREYLTIGNTEYMHFYFANYPTPRIQVKLNELSLKCGNLVKIYLVKIAGGGGDVAYYDWSLYNYLVYSAYISNPRDSQTITVELPNFRDRLFWLVSNHKSLKHPNLFDTAKITIRIDYISNIGGQYYRNIEGEGE